MSQYLIRHVIYRIGIRVFEKGLPFVTPYYLLLAPPKLIITAFSKRAF